ncbi:E3 SUMO-protein ligase RanBP2 [Trichinella zimbabwensis]|uniref:E3 SUMO-protein ligase RanBP2 n=1 Tax=Trichinella zimbabwensis TaxID=268475 RepID=A0A0V1H4B1_9BILA|nr:E3 SUMO-protein ligase RanBP2 [Trichinella zimbabwensis]
MDCNLIVQLTLQNERLKEVCQKMENLQTTQKVGEAEKVNQVLMAKDSLNVSKDLLATCGQMADKIDRVLEKLCKFDVSEVQFCELFYKFRVFMQEHIEKVGSHLQQFGNALQHLSTLASSTAIHLQTGVTAKASDFHLPTAKPPSFEKSVGLEELPEKEVSFNLKECNLQNEKAPILEAVVKKMPVLTAECKAPVKVIGQDDSLTSTKISPRNEDVSYGEDEPDIHFEPVISLPGLVDLKTGEEDEEVLFQDRVKLYRFDIDSKEYKERGVGKLKILRSVETGKLRLVMRREHVHKLAANHYIEADFELKPKGLRSYCWQCLDFSDGEMKPTTLAALFRSSDAANEFKLTIEKQLGGNKKETSNPVKVVEVNQPKPCSQVSKMPAVEEKKSIQDQESIETKKIGDVDFKFGKSSTDDQQRSSDGQSKIEGSQSNQLSSAFFNFSSTTSAEQNNKVHSVLPNADGQVKFSFPQPKLATGFNLKPESFSFKTENFDINSMKKTTDANLASNQVNNDQMDAAPKSHLFGFGLQQAKLDISSKKEVDSSKMQSADKPNSLDSKSWGFGALAALNQAGSWLSTKKEETNDDVSIKNEQNNEDVEKEKRSNSANDESIEEECDFVFKPVIPLPPKVDVVTGEEDEELILKLRCKLYRYVSDLKEYKERGAGDLKLLRNKRTCKYRLVMRQEKVLKVVVNHYISKEMKVQISERNDRLCIWQCRNFVDNELTEETLAARFRNVEAVKKFIGAINQAKILHCDDEPPAVEATANLNIGTDNCLLDKFKPKPSCWRCETCLEVNRPYEEACVCCHTVRYEVELANDLREAQMEQERQKQLENTDSPKERNDDEYDDTAIMIGKMMQSHCSCEGEKSKACFACAFQRALCITTGNLRFHNTVTTWKEAVMMITATNADGPVEMHFFSDVGELLYQNQIVPPILPYFTKADEKEEQDEMLTLNWEIESMHIQFSMMRETAMKMSNILKTVFHLTIQVPF